MAAERNRKFCSEECAHVIDLASFWGRVNKLGPRPKSVPHLGVCWVWTGRTDRDGYGWFDIGKLSRQAHRVSMEIRLGRRLNGRKECVLHACDNPPCVNPTHLRTGTDAQNYADMIKRGRERKPRGERNASSKLTADKVREIRAIRAAWMAAHPGDTKGSGEASTLALAARYGVTHQAVEALLKNRTWKHV
jgi:hypothetical protein